MADFDFKQGNNFGLTCSYQTDSGEAIPLDDITIDADLQDSSGRVVATLTVSRLPTVGDYYLSLSAAETAVFKVGHLVMDIRYAIAGAVISTDTRTVEVIRAVTRRT
jgi:hypothetical protein